MTKVLIDRKLLERALKSVRELIPDSDSDYAPAVQGVRKRKENVVKELRAALSAPQAPTAQSGSITKGQAKAILDMALDLEKTGRIVSLSDGQERSDYVARNRNIQCALEDYLRNLTGEAQG